MPSERVHYADAALHEVCALENAWRRDAERARFQTLLRARLPLPDDVLRKIAAARSTFATSARRGGDAGTFTLDLARPSSR